MTDLPPGARLIATNDFCPLAGFTHGDLVLTFQGHPEFRKDYSKDLMNMRRDLLGEDVWQAGMASLGGGDPRALGGAVDSQLLCIEGLIGDGPATAPF